MYQANPRPLFWTETELTVNSIIDYNTQKSSLKLWRKVSLTIMRNFSLFKVNDSL